MDVVGRVLRTLPEKVDLARPRPDHPWSFIDAPAPSGLDANEIHAAAVEFDSSLDEVQQAGIPVARLSLASDPAALLTWAQLAAEPRFDLAAVDAFHAQPGAGQRAEISQRLKVLTKSTPEWLTTVTVEAMDLDMPEIHGAAVAADESGFFGRKKRRREVLAQLANVMVVDPTTVKLKELSALTADVAKTHAEVTDLRERVAMLPVSLFDRIWNPLIPDDAKAIVDHFAATQRLGAILSASPTDPQVANLREFYRSTTEGASSNNWSDWRGRGIVSVGRLGLLHNNPRSGHLRAPSWRNGGVLAPTADSRRQPPRNVGWISSFTLSPFAQLEWPRRERTSCAAQ